MADVISLRTENWWPLHLNWNKQYQVFTCLNTTSGLQRLFVTEFVTLKDVTLCCTLPNLHDDLKSILNWMISYQHISCVIYSINIRISQSIRFAAVSICLISICKLFHRWHIRNYMYGITFIPVGHLDLMKSLRPSGAIWRRKTLSSLIQVMASSLLGTKPLPEPLQTSCQSDQKQTSVKSKDQHFYSWKCIWICRLHNGGHFILAIMC